MPMPGSARLVASVRGVRTSAAERISRSTAARGEGGGVDQVHQFVDPIRRDQIHPRRPGAGPGLQADEAELRQLPRVPVMTLSEVAELIDVRLDLAGQFESQLCGRLLHAAGVLADGLLGVEQRLHAQRDQHAVLLHRDRAVAGAGHLPISLYAHAKPAGACTRML